MTRNATEEVNKIIAELQEIADDMKKANAVLDRLLYDEEDKKDEEDED